MIRLRCLATAAGVLFALAPSLLSQSTYASITGLVTDSSGAALPDVTVEGVESNTGYRYTAFSNETGTYTLPDLREGVYRVRMSHPGLAESVIENVQLKPRDVRRLDVVLQVAAVATTVEVTGSAGLIEVDTENPQLSTTEERTYFRALPATVRRPWDFVNLAPLTRVSSFNLIRYAGSRSRQGEQAADGMVISRGDGSILSRSMDYTEMYSEFTIDAAGNSAEFATLGQMNFNSRSGTNQLHGDVHDFFTSPGLIARSTFSPINTVTKPVNKAGLSIGGPVVLPKIYNGRNKTFFMFNTEFTKSRGERVLVNPTVPLASWRTGDFSGQPTIVDPFNGKAPFPGNKIPTDRLNAVSLKMQNFYPLPTITSGNTLLSPNFIQNDFRPNFALPGYNGRVDHRFTDKSSVYFRYFQTWWILQNPGTDSRNLPLPAVPIVFGYDDTRSVMGSYIYNINPHIVNELRAQYSYTRSWTTQALNGKDAVASLGLQGLVNNLPNLGGYPNFNFTNIGLTQLTFVYSTDPGRRDRPIQIQDHVSWFRGKHTMKAGVQFQHYSTLSNSQNNGLFGNATFSNQYTGNTYADFLLGIPTSVSRSFVKPNDDIQRNSMGLFYTDEYKVSPTLTLTLGMRYEYIKPYTHADGLISIFDTATGNIVVPDSSMSKVSPLMPTGFVKVVPASQAGYDPTTLIRTDKNNFAPRIGAAWRPLGQNTVLRGGFGIYYDVVPALLTTTGVPFVISEPTYTNPAINPTVILPQIFPATSTGAPSSVTLPSAARKDIRIPYSIQVTATLEHAFRNTVFRISYAGTGTRQGVYTSNANQPVPDTRLFINKPRPFPLYPAIPYLTNGAGHQYQGGSATISRRTPFHGLQWDLGFTHSRDIGDLDYGQSPEDAYNLRRERSPWTDLPSDRFTGIFFYDLPFGKNRALFGSAGKVVNLLIGDWKITSKSAFETGLFLTPSWTGPDPTGTAYTSNSTPAQVTIRPNAISDPNISNPTLTHWFDANAFTAPTPGSFGSSAKGVIVGPNLISLGGSLQKFITYRERLRVRLELLTNNYINHANVGSPATNISNKSSVGVITSQSLDGIKQDDAGPRRILVHIRIEF